MAEIALIRDSYSYIHDKHPELVLLIKEIESDFSPNSITEAINHNIRVALEFGKSRKEAQSPEKPILEPTLTIFDLGILQIFELAYIFIRHRDDKPVISWCFKHNHASAPEPIEFFYVALTHIYNTLLSIRMLLLKGFDAQVRVLSRSYIESAELLLAVNSDSKLYNQFIDYSQAEVSDKLVLWRKYLSPKKIRKRIIRILEEEELDRESVADFKQSLQETYQLLSESTHPSWLGMLFGSYSVHSKSNMALQLSLGGMIGELSQLTIGLMLDHLFIFSMMLIHLLWKKHQWRLVGSDIDNLVFLYQQKVFEHLYLSLKPEIQSLMDKTTGILIVD